MLQFINITTNIFTKKSSSFNDNIIQGVHQSDCNGEI